MTTCRVVRVLPHVFIFFFNDTATTEIYTLSLHDALPISAAMPVGAATVVPAVTVVSAAPLLRSEEHTSELQSPEYLVCRLIRSEEHTSELQSPAYLVCRLLLEKKTTNDRISPTPRNSRRATSLGHSFLT